MTLNLFPCVVQELGIESMVTSELSSEFESELDESTEKQV